MDPTFPERPKVIHIENKYYETRVKAKISQHAVGKYAGYGESRVFGVQIHECPGRFCCLDVLKWIASSPSTSAFCEIRIFKNNNLEVL